MKQGLTLDSMCEILLRRNIITPEQHQRILAEKDVQVKRLEKINEISANGSGLRYDVLPCDVISAFNLTVQLDGGEEPLTEEKVMREVAAVLNIPFKKIDPLELDLEVVTRTLPKNFAIKNLAVPIAREAG